MLIVELLVERVAANLSDLDDLVHGRALEATLGDRPRQGLKNRRRWSAATASAEIARGPLGSGLNGWMFGGYRWLPRRIGTKRF